MFIFGENFGIKFEQQKFQLSLVLCDVIEVTF